MTPIMNWKLSNVPPNLGMRLLAILLVGGCLGLMFWSVTIRLDLVTQAQSTMHSPFSLTRELERLRTSWSDPQAEAVDRDWEEFQSKNFTDDDQLVRWISRFSTRAESMGLQVAYKIGEEGQPVQGMPTVRPVSIEFSFQSPTDQDGYRHFVRFMREVSESKVGITIDKVELSGTGQGVQKLELTLLGYMNHST